MVKVPINKCVKINSALSFCELTGNPCQYMNTPINCPDYDKGIISRKRGKLVSAESMLEQPDTLATEEEIKEIDTNNRLIINTEKPEGISEWLKRTKEEFTEMVKEPEKQEEQFIRPVPQFACNKCGNVNWRIKSGIFKRPEVLTDILPDGNASYFIPDKGEYSSGWVCAVCDPPGGENEPDDVKYLGKGKFSTLPVPIEMPEDF